MEFKLSNHASKRIKQRKIKHEWIQVTITAPDSLESDSEDSTVLHALLEIPERGFKRLRVVYNETTKPVTIVTAYFE